MSTEEVKHETAAAVAAEEAEDHEDAGVETGESEEPQAYFEPVVKLNEVEVVSGEEDEEHKEAGKVRMLMRQEKTLKITINHLVESRAELGANMGSDRAWVWTCYDFSEGVVEAKTFALRFANAENAQAFKEAHDNAKKINKALEAGADAEDTSAGDAAAKALESLDVKKD
ncbi:hypothetical protein SPRG_22197 [Saprolegnia parasitica CBS 223.65]|uniref:RanBD1 domain-containing protein n=1 Tax=Saprolegnia parasitica (strain CBS 223.65) TaxID=695850 RepID=A0A067CEZ8_SAPPC|nr:hypothetical protein SPRG_22197 [Saprolegnia parasitica CBS 223.65]KDO27725.1 hypothetical protein SPRG_22197 [Saprolegnia parasitica CBS 223.65]|eukprot:XP_012201631.1 hypothetical protein SPRG_22197 [Saprolegnia parasitica CBS 223.65]